MRGIKAKWSCTLYNVLVPQGSEVVKCEKNPEKPGDTCLFWQVKRPACHNCATIVTLFNRCKYIVKQSNIKKIAIIIRKPAPESVQNFWAKRIAERLYNVKCPVNLSLKVSVAELGWTSSDFLLFSATMSSSSSPFLLRVLSCRSDSPHHGLGTVQRRKLGNWSSQDSGLDLRCSWVFSPAPLILSSSPPLSLSLQTSAIHWSIYLKYIFDF